MKMKGILVIGAIIAIVLLLGTGFSGAVYAKTPERLDTVNKVQSKINGDFMRWYEKNRGRLPELSKKNIRVLFVMFLKDNPLEGRYLKHLTYLEEKTHKGMKIENGYARVMYSSQDYEKIRVTITYFRIHIGWWTLTYGEDDKIDAYLHGKYAKDFYDEWENSETDIAYGTAIGGIISGIVGGDIGKAIGIALGVAAIAAAYETSEMNKYYESTGWRYIWIVLNNNYYYLWVPGFNYASSTGVYGYNAERHSTYTFWWNIPWVVAGGLDSCSGYLSNSAHNWVNKHGNGWVYVH